MFAALVQLFPCRVPRPGPFCIHIPSLRAPRLHLYPCSHPAPARAGPAMRESSRTWSSTRRPGSASSTQTGQQPPTSAVARRQPLHRAYQWSPTFKLLRELFFMDVRCSLVGTIRLAFVFLFLIHN